MFLVPNREKNMAIILLLRAGDKLNRPSPFNQQPTPINQLNHCRIQSIIAFSIGKAFISTISLPVFTTIPMLFEAFAIQ
jgi:hypothetical protein